MWVYIQWGLIRDQSLFMNGEVQSQGWGHQKNFFTSNWVGHKENFLTLEEWELKSFWMSNLKSGLNGQIMFFIHEINVIEVSTENLFDMRKWVPKDFANKMRVNTKKISVTIHFTLYPLFINNDRSLSGKGLTSYLLSRPLFATLLMTSYWQYTVSM